MECLDRSYLNGYIGPLATPGGLVTFMREQLGKPIPSPVVLGQVTERFREAVRIKAERESIPVYQFDHKERKDDVANQMRRQRGVRDGIVFIGGAQEKAQAFSGKKIGGQFEFTRDKTVYVNHYYFYIDDADFGPLFLKEYFRRTEDGVRGGEHEGDQLWHQPDRAVYSIRTGDQYVPIMGLHGPIAWHYETELRVNVFCLCAMQVKSNVGSI